MSVLNKTILIFFSLTEVNDLSNVVNGILVDEINRDGGEFQNEQIDTDNIFAGEEVYKDILCPRRDAVVM